MLSPDRRTSRFSWCRLFTFICVGLASVITVTGCSPLHISSGAKKTEVTKSIFSPGITYEPGIGKTDVNPQSPISVSVGLGVLSNITLKSSTGTRVKGKYDIKHRTWTTSEVLGYGKTYTWEGTVTEENSSGEEKNTAPLSGSFTTINPRVLISAQSNIGDGQVVGIAAPIMIQFDGLVANKAAVERALKVSSSQPAEGSWAWLSPTAQGDRIHYRTRKYWPAHTKVDVKAKFYGLDFGNGAFGASDFGISFNIGRNQIVKAHVPSYRMQVYRDGKMTMDIAASYGAANEARNVTRSGIHVISERHRTVLMTNLPYYKDTPEHFALRISNNGEFIHANPMTLAYQGNRNVSNGCVNLSTPDAEAYYNSTLYGDPIEVTGTDINLSEADGDIWDWAARWEDWKSWSALPAEEEIQTEIPAAEAPAAEVSPETPSRATS